MGQFYLWCDRIWHILFFGTGPSFHKLYFCCLGKHSQTETDFKTKFLLMKGENSVTSYCDVLAFKLAKIRWPVKKILVFWSTEHRLFMDDYSKHNSWFGRWMGAWFWIDWGEGEWIVSESDGNTAKFTAKIWAFCVCVCVCVCVFPAHPNFVRLCPNSTLARGNDSLRITRYEKG